MVAVAAREMVVIVGIVFGGLNLRVWSAIAGGIMDGEGVKALSPMSEAAIIIASRRQSGSQFRNLPFRHAKRGKGRMLRGRECRLPEGFPYSNTWQENLLLGVI